MFRKSRWKRRSKTSAVLLASVFLASCNNVPTTSATSVTKPYVSNSKPFLPLEGEQKEAVYSVDGTTTDYKLKIVKEGPDVMFRALSQGMVVDEEAYTVQGNQIFLLRAAGETFVEPIKLLEFPLRVGDKYLWQGLLTCSEETIQGTATVMTSSDFVRAKDKSEDAIKVEVNLSFGKGATRKLSFWFVKGKGILKTEMGKNVREPKL